MGIQAEYSGPVEKGFRAWAERLDGKRQRHLGLLHGAALKDWIRSLDLVVVPSRWLETGPLTLLEAWDQGVPVLGAGAGGIRDFMVANRQGHMLFERGSAHDLTRALEDWIRSDPAQAETVHVPGMRSVAKMHVQIYSGLGSFS